MSGLQTEFELVLPKGYVDPDGGLHRLGRMRLATARDELEPLRDPSIDGPDDPLLTVLVLARVITSLGSLSSVDVEQIEGLFAVDLAFLQDFYGVVNFGSAEDVAELLASQQAAISEVRGAERSAGAEGPGPESFLSVDDDEPVRPRLEEVQRAAR